VVEIDGEVKFGPVEVLGEIDEAIIVGIDFLEDLLEEVFLDSPDA
jgi:hypothetical protein